MEARITSLLDQHQAIGEELENSRETNKELETTLHSLFAAVEEREADLSGAAHMIQKLQTQLGASTSDRVSLVEAASFSQQVSRTHAELTAPEPSYPANINRLPNPGGNIGGFAPSFQNSDHHHRRASGQQPPPPREQQTRISAQGNLKPESQVDRQISKVSLRRSSTASSDTISEPDLWTSFSLSPALSKSSLRSVYGLKVESDTDMSNKSRLVPSLALSEEKREELQHPMFASQEADLPKSHKDTNGTNPRKPGKARTHVRRSDAKSINQVLNGLNLAGPHDPSAADETHRSDAINQMAAGNIASRRSENEFPKGRQRVYLDNGKKIGNTPQRPEESPEALRTVLRMQGKRRIEASPGRYDQIDLAMTGDLKIPEQALHPYGQLRRPYQSKNSKEANISSQMRAVRAKESEHPRKRHRVPYEEFSSLRLDGPIFEPGRFSPKPQTANERWRGSNDSSLQPPFVRGDTAIPARTPSELDETAMRSRADGETPISQYEYGRTSIMAHVRETASHQSISHADTTPIDEEKIARRSSMATRTGFGAQPREVFEGKPRHTNSSKSFVSKLGLFRSSSTRSSKSRKLSGHQFLG